LPFEIGAATSAWRSGKRLIWTVPSSEADNNSRLSALNSTKLTDPNGS
jgi:hypothetical protein